MSPESLLSLGYGITPSEHGISQGVLRHLSCLFVVCHFVPVRPERQIPRPIRWDGHDAAGFLHAALTDGHFHNRLIVDVEHDGITRRFEV